MEKAKKLLTVIIIIAILVIVAIYVNKQMIKTMYKKEYSEYVSKYAQEYRVDENLIYAMIKAESNFEVDAVSHQSAKGLMQLMDTTAQETAKKVGIQVTEENILEPEININLGTKYISILLEKYECVEIAVAAYNAGTGTVDKWIKNGTIKADGSDIENIPFKETNTYVRKIVRNYKIYTQLEN